MDAMKTMMIAAAGMRAQSARMSLIAENIANANSLAPSKDEDPYRRKVATFQSTLDRELGVRLVRMPHAVTDATEFGLRYDPGHPAADDKGYVRTPNVNALIEMVDMRAASRSYEANLNVIEAARSMMNRTLDLLRR